MDHSRNARLRSVAVTVLIGLLAAVLAVMPNATAAGPQGAAAPVTAAAAALPDCLSSKAADNCTVLAMTPTSLTMQFTIVYVHQPCPGVYVPGCWTDIYIYGAPWLCPGFSTPVTGYFPYSKATPGSLTCTATITWGADRPPEVYMNALEEQSGGSGIFQDGGHSFRVPLPVPPPKPTASFTATPTPGAASATYTFDGRSSSVPTGTIASYAWDFGDGKTASGAVATHRFPASGTYTVSLVVTSAAGAVSAPKKLAVQAVRGALSVSVDADLPAGGLGVGDTLEVPITVSAAVDSFTGVSLAVKAATAALTVSGLPPEAASFALPAGKSRTFIVKVRGDAVGTSSVAAEVRGTASPGGEVVVDRDSAVVPVAARQLAISIAAAPRAVQLPVDTKARVAPKKITVTVRLTNTGKKPITSVVLERLWPRPVDKTLPLDQIDFARKTFPVRIGTLNPKASVLRRLPLTVTGDGQYKIDALAQYRVGATTQTATGTGGRFTVIVPPLWFKADMEGSFTRKGVEWVKGDQSFFLSGQVRNLSSYKTLCLWPLRPTMRGNAGGTGPVDIRTYGVGRNVVAPPVAGPLAPGVVVPFGMTVRTRSDGGTRATVVLDPQASQIDPGDECQAAAAAKLKPLPAKHRVILPGSTLHTGAIDVSVPMAPPASAADVVANFFGGFTIGSVSTLGEWMRSTAVGAREAASGYTTRPELLLPTLEGVNAMGAFLVAYWDSASPQEKATLTGKVASVLRRAPGDTWRTVSDGVSASFEDYMRKIEAAYASGDSKQLAYEIGYGGGSGVTSVGIDMVLGELGVGLAKKMPALQNVFAKIGGESVTFATMKDIPTGKLLNPTEMRRIWGAAAEDIAAFKRIAKEEGVLIGIRSRSPISVKNLGEGAVWKHENLKPKNVSPLDIAWLGFRREDAGLVALKEYSTVEQEAILARIKKAPLTATQRAEVLDRAKTRFNEAPKYLEKIKGMADKGEIDVGFNYSDNGIDLPNDVKIRKFGLSGAQEASGSVYYRPWQQNLGRTFKPGAPLPSWCSNFGGTLGILCRVTGDMDGVYLTDIAGRGLPKDKVVAVYKKLAEAGWQHPETFTWVDQMTGKFFFDAKEKILAGLTKGGEKMMEFAPDGKIRATWIDLKKSLLVSPRDFLVVRRGGFTALSR